ncbi:MAG: hypothetical protein ACRDT4_05165 [Micromonosporaceae bacterium]
MKLEQLRQAVALMADLPGDLDVQYVTKTGTVKPLDAIRWTPLVGFMPRGGIAAYERDDNK